jgi:chromosome segregation ATPase
MCLEEYDHQVEAKDHLIDELRKGNRELLHQNHSLERRNKELNDDLLRTCHNLEFKIESLKSTRTQLQHTNDELASAHSAPRDRVGGEGPIA